MSSSCGIRSRPHCRADQVCRPNPPAWADKLPPPLRCVIYGMALTMRTCVVACRRPRLAAHHLHHPAAGAAHGLKALPHGPQHFLHILGACGTRVLWVGAWVQPAGAAWFGCQSQRRLTAPLQRLLRRVRMAGSAVGFCNYSCQTCDKSKQVASLCDARPKPPRLSIKSTHWCRSGGRRGAPVRSAARVRWGRRLPRPLARLPQLPSPHAQSFWWVKVGSRMVGLWPRQEQPFGEVLVCGHDSWMGYITQHNLSLRGRASPAPPCCAATATLSHPVATHLQPRSHHSLAVRCPTVGRAWNSARVAPPTVSPRRRPRESVTATSALQPSGWSCQLGVASGKCWDREMQACWPGSQVRQPQPAGQPPLKQGPSTCPADRDRLHLKQSSAAHVPVWVMSPICWAAGAGVAEPGNTGVQQQRLMKQHQQRASWAAMKMAQCSSQLLLSPSARLEAGLPTVAGPSNPPALRLHTPVTSPMNGRSPPHMSGLTRSALARTMAAALA